MHITAHRPATCTETDLDSLNIKESISSSGSSLEMLQSKMAANMAAHTLKYLYLSSYVSYWPPYWKNECPSYSHFEISILLPLNYPNSIIIYRYI